MYSNVLATSHLNVGIGSGNIRGQSLTIANRVCGINVMGVQNTALFSSLIHKLNIV